ncbi:AMP-binding protein [Pseudooceanicola sp.]|uniref:AMP-binding protein n=1 Tax=Pseudooceanicola sp. TaxID=1914328 RepID=UPI004059128D
MTLKTTRPVRTVRTLADIEAIEARPYDDLVPARNLYDLFRATADAHGDRPALTVLRTPDPEDAGTALTHAGLLAEVTRAANLFHGTGLRPGAGVAAFLVPTLPELPTLMLGAQVAGVASSINYLLTAGAIADLLRAQGARVLVIPARHLDATCWDRAEGLLGAVPTLERILVIGDETEGRAGHEPLSPLLAAAAPDALDFTPSADRATVCALFHTGGTTGRPKVVRLTHGNQIHAAFGFAQVFGYDESDVVINGFPFFHVGGTITVGLSVLAAGGHMIVPSPYALRPPEVIARYWDLVRHFGVTMVNGVPTSIGALTGSFPPGFDVSRIRMAGTGGAILPAAVGARFTKATGIPMFETYGMTETAAAIAFNPGRGTPVPGSVGFRAPFSETRIVSPDTGAACPSGTPGLVQVRGPQVFPGYADPAQNEGVLDADGWLTTGDLGALSEDGRLTLTGRAKDLIVRSGHNIDPAAIEEVANRFDGVEISAAVGMPDQYAGEVPVLFIAPARGARPDLQALRAHLEAELHERPALPRRILEIEALPVTAVGKIFKPTLRDLALREKVRLEVEAVCGADAAAEVELGADAQGKPLVTVAVTGTTPDRIAALQAALEPLPQGFVVTAAADEAVRLEVSEGVATLTLDRPDSLNAMSQEMMTALDRQFDALERVTDLRVVIITGAGRGFCAGGDLLEFETALKAGKDRLLGYLRRNRDIIQRVEDLPVPVIGAVNGVAIAGGLELLLCCDILIAAESARISDGHARYAIVPAAGSTVRLPERIAPSRAAQMLYTGAALPAETLRDWGLVNEVVPGDLLMTRAHEIAAEIRACSPEVNRHVKALTGREARDPARQERMEAELQHFAQHVEGRDLARGLAAFREKRRPDFG